MSICPGRLGNSSKGGSASGEMTWIRGDLVFFQTRRNRIHVGIFLGGNEFFHLSSRNRAGKVDNLESSYFNSRFICGVRVKEAGLNLKAEYPVPFLRPEEEKPPVSVRHVPHLPGG